ncbi:MAG: hypothetical protein NTY32_06965 [Bacteroidia bacterium]|nr:hypothetical protein [Bacteroidia bacterium]
MKRLKLLLVLLLVLNFVIEAKTQTKVRCEKASVCLTLQAENGSIKQRVNEDGTITCIIKPGDVIRVSTIVLNGEDVTNQLEYNTLNLPLLTANTTLEITFESISSYNQPVYNTIAMF